MTLDTPGGRTVRLTPRKADARIVSTDLEDITESRKGARTVYEISCVLAVDGVEHEVVRRIPADESFYEPWNTEGLSIWFDAVSCAFVEDGGFLKEKDTNIGITCQPGKDVRLAVQSEDRDICPEPLHPWCPLPEGGLKIEYCYQGEACPEWAGQIVRENLAAQGNTLTGPEVVSAMAETLVSAGGELSDRLLAALSAGQEAGGDWRGRQSAALLVVREGCGRGYGDRGDRYVDLRVDDHATPVTELVRIYNVLRKKP